jgi:hypothetical protein
MIDDAQEKVLSNIQEDSNSNSNSNTVKEDDASRKVHIGFESMSWKELCAEAKKRGITGVSHMNRKKLADILNKKEGSVVSSDHAQDHAQDEPELVGTDLASIHDFPENGSPI